MPEKSFTYGSYLKLDSLLNLQEPKSSLSGAPAHDEMMFIIIHQAYELWFKLILHELDSAIAILEADFVDEKDIALVLARFKRVQEIQNLLLQQFAVLETMTPLDFLDFRDALGSSSGFQSLQFRLVEIRLGLEAGRRENYAGASYDRFFGESEKRKIHTFEGRPTLFAVLDRWLARTPFLDDDDFHFLPAYERAVERMLSREYSVLPNQSSHSAEAAAGTARRAFYTESEYQALREKGLKRLSWDATLAALFISLYRDEPLLHLPFRLIEGVIDIDERFALWRYRHAIMVHKMLGNRPGTGGSSGFEYLRSTVEKHRIFSDLFDIASLLIPRSELPALPPHLRESLGYFCRQSPQAGNTEN